MSKRLQELDVKINTALTYGVMSPGNDFEEYDPRTAIGWEDYITHQPIGDIGSSFPSQSGQIISTNEILTNKKVEEREEEERKELRETFNKLLEQPPPEEAGVPAAPPEATPAPPGAATPAGEPGGLPPGEPAGAPGAGPLEVPGATPGMGMGGVEAGTMGTGGTQGPAESTEEVGRIYELKKIYSRLASLESYLSEATNPKLLRLRELIVQSIEMFNAFVSNMRLYKDRLDEIIVVYYDFLEEVYTFLQKYLEKHKLD